MADYMGSHKLDCHHMIDRLSSHGAVKSGHVAEIKSYLPLFARQSDTCMNTSLDFWQVSTLNHDLWGPA